MAPMSQEQFIKAKLKMRDRFARIILRKLDGIYERYAARPRMQRGCKEPRAARQALEAFATATEARALASPEARRTTRGTGDGTRARKPRSPAGRETTDRDQERLK